MIPLQIAPFEQATELMHPTRHAALQAAEYHAWVHCEGGDLERARELSEENLREARLEHDPFPEGVALGLLADIALDQGRVQDALSPTESPQLRARRFAARSRDRPWCAPHAAAPAGGRARRRPARPRSGRRSHPRRSGRSRARASSTRARSPPATAAVRSETSRPRTASRTVGVARTPRCRRAARRRSHGRAGL
jgi:hypothetical protein